MSVNSVREDEAQIEVSKKDTLRRLYRYLIVYKKELVIVGLLLFVTVSISLFSPLLIERAIDVHVANRDITRLLCLGLFGFGLYVIFTLGTRLWMLRIAKVTNRVLVIIREELYAHIQTLSFHFFDSRPTGKVLARIIGDVNSLKEMLSDSITKLVPELLTVAGVAVIMLIKNWKLALAALLTLPILTVGMFVIQTVTHRRWQVYRKKSSNLNAFIHEDMAGIGVIQSFAAEEETRDDFYRLADEQCQSFVDAVRVADLFGPLVEITWGLGAFLLYFIGIKVVGAENVGIGTFLAFATYLGMFWNPIRNLANFYNKLVTNLSAAERIFDILDTPADIIDKEGAVMLPKVKGAVRFDHVTFAYSDEPEQNVLEDVSFQVQPGQTIALVGPTGAGKTTIVNLISRFYDVTSGKIYLDDYEVHDVTLQSLRSQMGIMTQDNFLFTGTIRENICYGKLDATDEEMVAAAKAVNAHDFIMKLEGGYDTEISERGTQLSIGQRQLLAFARTMISNPGILILDEATSSIDTHTELLVQDGIRHMLANRTSFVVAHRLSTIRSADRIFVIDAKGIQEDGSHEELMAKKGAYYRLYQSQFEETSCIPL
ncbi:MAG: ABC transporter ATP-binding protein [Lachnospiraceae bacterium]|nr:ABC transporter ATP-binding protein [Lachnospiraceae bacterium]MDD3795953.1 ABC transporter ATP-binding protein [Lachnospiraceae bacterium]